VAHASSSSTEVAKAEGSHKKFEASLSKTARPHLKGVLYICVCGYAYIYIRNLHNKLEVTNYNYHSMG
jgi:hypothetical protein